MAYLTDDSNKWGVASVALLALTASQVAYGATITVTTTADPGLVTDCSLRAAMTAAVSKTAIDACPAGTGDDSIVFQAGVTGTILPSSGLPLVTKGKLSITGPDGSPGERPRLSHSVQRHRHSDRQRLPGRGPGMRAARQRPSHLPGWGSAVRLNHVRTLKQAVIAIRKLLVQR